MKHRLLPLRASWCVPALALALLAPLPLPLSAQAPPLQAPEAAAIAQQDLEMRGLLNEVFIAEVRYKKSLLGGEEYWEVRWSKSFPAQTEGRNEFGLKIAMDGNYTRSVR